MKYQPQTILLKSGKSILIREATSNDAEQLLACTKEYIGISEFIPKEAEEHNLTLEQEKEWIEGFLLHENSILLVAEYEGSIVGNIDLAGNKRLSMQHTGVIGMGLLPAFQNQGLGTALLQAVIDFGRTNPILEILWLQLYSANEVGLAAYKKVGFVENGVIPNFFKRNGVYHDCLTMSMTVN